MRIVRFTKSAVICLAITCGLSACGPNVFKAQGTVLNPTYAYQSEDKEVARSPRLLVIIRKEIRNAKQYRIVGPMGEPAALKPFQEYAMLPEQQTDGSALYVDTRIFTNYRDELTGDGLGKFEFWLELPDGRKIKGGVHARRGIVDYTSNVSGAHMQTHQVIRDSSGFHAYRHVEEVYETFELFSRRGRILFVGPGLVDPKTPYLVFVVKGYQREWRYHFDLTNDPMEAAGWAATHVVE